MFSKHFTTLFTQEILLEAAKSYAVHAQYALLLKIIKSGALLKSLRDGSYIPGANRAFEMPKSSGGVRTISVGELSDRVVQKVVVNALESYFVFSDKSYAYRPNKGPVKAIHRVLDFVKRGHFWIVRTDIKTFFDTIDQKVLGSLLQREIEDQRLVSLMALFFKNGVLQKHQYHSKVVGVHQGDPLSPFLSNLYLDSFDKVLEKSEIAFVRYGDDLVICAKERQEASEYLDVVQRELGLLKLQVNVEKTVVTNISQGFEYLGVFIQNHTVRVENSRLNQKVQKVQAECKKLSLADTVIYLNEQIKGFSAYYKKVLTDRSQLKQLQTNADEIVMLKIIQAKKSGEISRQAGFLNALAPLKFYIDLDSAQQKAYYKVLVHKAYDKMRSETPLKEAERKIEKKKNEILKKQNNISELVLTRNGLFLGYSRGRAVVKDHGKVLKSVPMNTLTRMMIVAQTSLSTEIIFQAAKRGIDIDLYRRNEPYAMISYYRQVSHKLQREQHALQSEDRGLQLAKFMIRAKIKNQINLVKYFSRYREGQSKKLHLKLSRIVEKIEKISERIQVQTNRDALRGIEGSSSALYWQGFGLLIGDKSYTRVTRDAGDVVNQALNYGYAILYNRVQSALIGAYLDIYSPLLHEPAANKPTLVFDLIEEFRQSVVDREIIAIINHHQVLKSSNGRLTQESIKVITEHIQTRLSGTTLYRGRKERFERVIREQALLLAKAIKGEKKYRGFVNKF